jgi:hypothetical protein
MGLAHWGGVCRKARTVAVLAVAVTAAAVVGFGGPASADVQIQPGEFYQGNPAQFTFIVTNTGPAPMTRVEMRMPESHPIAEVYPMSVDGWAPQINFRPLDNAMTDRHGGTVTEVVTAITWWAMPGSELPPGAKAELKQSMWVLPELDRMEIGIVETFANGTVTNSIVTVTLNPPPATTDGATAGADTAATEPTESRGSNLWWMFGLLVLIGAVTAFALLRQRRSEPIDAAVDDDETDEPAPRAVKVRSGTSARPTKAGSAARTTAGSAARTTAGSAARTTAGSAAKKTASGTAGTTAKTPTKAAGRTPVKSATKRIRAGR